MSDDTLKPQERAALLLLMAVGSEIGNPDLQERFGVRLTGPGRKTLNELKLVSSRKLPGHGTALFHELTDPGWARARQELTGELPASLWGRSVALALAAQIDGYLARTGLALAELFGAPGPDEEGAPTDEDPPATVVDAPSASAPSDLGDRIRAVYWSLASEPNAWIGLADLRERFTDVPRDALDEALRLVGRAGDVTIAPESNKKSLTEADKAAAVRIGRQDKHLIAIEGA